MTREIDLNLTGFHFPYNRFNDCVRLPGILQKQVFCCLSSGKHNGRIMSMLEQLSMCLRAQHNHGS